MLIRDDDSNASDRSAELFGPQHVDQAVRQQPVPADAWLEQCRARVKELCDADQPLPKQERLDALNQLASQSLALAQQLLDLANLAHQASQRLLDESPG